MTQEVDFTRDEALAFVESMRVALEGRVGFKWFASRLSALASYIQGIADENERLKDELERRGVAGG